VEVKKLAPDRETGAAKPGPVCELGGDDPGPDSVHGAGNYHQAVSLRSRSLMQAQAGSEIRQRLQTNSRELSAILTVKPAAEKTSGDCVMGLEKSDLESSEEDQDFQLRPLNMARRGCLKM